jgi:heme A synthase
MVSGINMTGKITLTVLCFLIIFISGYWLSHFAKPFNVLILTIHKLVSLVAIVLLVLTALQMNKATRLDTKELAAWLVAGLFFVVTIITGGLLSSEISLPAAIAVMHKITPYMTVVSTAVALYLSMN